MNFFKALFLGVTLLASSYVLAGDYKESSRQKAANAEMQPEDTMDHTSMKNREFGTDHQKMNTQSARNTSTTANTTQVRQVQKKLNQEGLSVTEDGIIGSETTTALKQFQRKNNLTANGRMSTETLQALGVETDGKAGMPSDSQTRRPASVQDPDTSMDMTDENGTDTETEEYEQ